MPAGTPVLRHWVLVLHNGTIVVDWGGGQSQDVFSGEFLSMSESEVSHSAQTDELEMLKRASRISHYDSHQVWFINLPERPVRIID
jgi:hypothetical protein